jgi:hypothetical protein
MRASGRTSRWCRGGGYIRGSNPESNRTRAIKLEAMQKTRRADDLDQSESKSKPIRGYQTRTARRTTTALQPPEWVERAKSGIKSQSLHLPSLRHGDTVRTDGQVVRVGVAEVDKLVLDRLRDPRSLDNAVHRVFGCEDFVDIVAARRALQLTVAGSVSREASSSH